MWYMASVEMVRLLFWGHTLPESASVPDEQGLAFSFRGKL